MKSVCIFFSPILSFISGYALVRYLTCQPVSMGFYMLLTCLSGFIALMLLYKAFRLKCLFRTALIASIACFVTGYMLALCLFMNVSEKRDLPVITRAKGDPGKGHTAIIVLAHGEPETYDPGAWIKQMKELDQQNIPFVPYPLRPFFFNSLREKYLLAGKSGHNAECLQIMNELEAEYRLKGDKSTRFYISYLENEPYPDTAAIRALNDGAGQIVLCNIFLTTSNHTKEALNMIKAVGLEDYGVDFKYTKPLYDSKILQRLYVESVNSNSSAAGKDNTGVILVGHGQPEEWDKEFPTETQHEMSFKKAILKLLENEGYKPDNLKLAWMEFREPAPEAAIEELVKNGVDEIFYFSTIIGSESIHAKYDVPALVNKARIPKNIKLRQLTAFENKSGIVKALMEKIDEALCQFD